MLRLLLFCVTIPYPPNLFFTVNIVFLMGGGQGDFHGKKAKTKTKDYFHFSIPAISVLK